MGRREAPITTANQALAALALWLRAAKAGTGLSYPALAEKAGYHPSNLRRAASGDRVPSQALVTAYATACGARADHALELWREARYEARRAAQGRRVSRAAPRPELVRDVADLSAGMIELYDKAGAPTFREMEASKAGQHGRLPHSTVHRIVTKQAIPKCPVQFAAFLQACGVEEDECRPWFEAWHRVWQTEAEEADPRLRSNSTPATPTDGSGVVLLSPGTLADVQAAGYTVLPWDGIDHRVLQLSCIACQRTLSVKTRQLNTLQACSCRAPYEPHHPPSSHFPQPGTGADSVEDQAVLRALKALELARARLRAPLADPVDEHRAVEELRQALRLAYVVMAEQQRLAPGLRRQAQELLDRSTDLLEWVEAGHPHALQEVSSG
ncbi:helix-turn-helix transcriptional regulator [Streptomyces olivaceiscleroticus]|uniref:HTH cro/C1-type domain-containing protein n=1 Tax=Streptomyces olivaceiscleroticus TaxID=68245 RepID=A0ABN0ZNF4_9ACTN